MHFLFIKHLVLAFLLSTVFSGTEEHASCSTEKNLVLERKRKTDELESPIPRKLFVKSIDSLKQPQPVSKNKKTTKKNTQKDKSDADNSSSDSNMSIDTNLDFNNLSIKNNVVDQLYAKLIEYLNIQNNLCPDKKINTVEDFFLSLKNNPLYKLKTIIKRDSKTSLTEIFQELLSIFEEIKIIKMQFFTFFVIKHSKNKPSLYEIIKRLTDQHKKLLKYSDTCLNKTKNMLFILNLNKISYVFEREPAKLIFDGDEHLEILENFTKKYNSNFQKKSDSKQLRKELDSRLVLKRGPSFRTKTMMADFKNFIKIIRSDISKCSFFKPIDITLHDSVSIEIIKNKLVHLEELLLLFTLENANLVLKNADKLTKEEFCTGYIRILTLYFDLVEYIYFTKFVPLTYQLITKYEPFLSNSSDFIKNCYPSCQENKIKIYHPDFITKSLDHVEFYKKCIFVDNILFWVGKGLISTQEILKDILAKFLALN